MNKKHIIRISLLTLCILGAVLLLYRSAILHLITAVLHREGSSHGLFVPFISAYFLWMKRERLRAIALGYDYLGLLLVAIALVFPFLDFVSYKIQALSFFPLIAGLVILFLGKAFFKEIAFPLLFLITMIPIPTDVNVMLATHIRDISFGVSSWIVYHLGIPFAKEGIMVYLPDAVLKVNLGCSGIRYLISFFVFGIAYAYLSRNTTFARLTLIAATIPISLLASILRLTSIFLLTYWFGPRMSEYWPHVFISWGVFFTVLVVCVALDWHFSAKPARVPRKQLIAHS